MPILRHLEAEDFDLVPSMPKFDGFAWHSRQEDPIVKEKALALSLEVKKWWVYKQVLTHPEPDWIGKGNAWFDLIASLPKLTTPKGEVAAAWAYDRPMIDWHLLDQGKLLSLARSLRLDAMVLENSNGLRPGFLLDLAWRRPRDWMFKGYPAYSNFPADWWIYWERRFLRFLGFLDRSGLMHHSNGDRTLPGPLYLEHAECNWQQDFNIWFNTPGHILSVLADDEEAVERLVEVAAESPEKWIAFTAHNNEAGDTAYAYAAEVLKDASKNR